MSIKRMVVAAVVAFLGGGGLGGGGGIFVFSFYSCICSAQLSVSYKESAIEIKSLLSLTFFFTSQYYLCNHKCHLSLSVEVI